MILKMYQKEGFSRWLRALLGGDENTDRLTPNYDFFQPIIYLGQVGKSFEKHVGRNL